MADIETSIGIGVDTSNALAAIKNLQREISAFHTSLAKGSSAAAEASAKLQKDLVNTLNATGQFSASMTTVKSTTESFTNALEKNKLSMGEYFRYAGGASRNFSRFFSNEFETINKVARERVKDLQTQYVQLGRDANGAIQAIKVRPLVLDMQDLGTQSQITAQKQQIFNQLLRQGSTNLLNFGKNTQWAGRQLMVGFTIPLTMFGTTASKVFMDLEMQAIRFKRVYGELFTTTEETDAMVKSLQELSLEFTKYGVAVEKTMSLAADAAAMGKTGNELLAQVTEANRLAVLGNVEQAQALETTISVTNAFGTATEDLAKKIDFLNAVENQTVTSIEDLTIAIPKAGPVVKQLGGDVEDLAFFLTAMKEGGINASEGANALKSGLASIINPTEKASEFLKGFGINIQNIVDANKGDIKGIVIDFAQALDTLDPLNRAQAIEQLFGKFQFSRLSTLFQNVIAEGTQAERVLALTNSTVQELSALSEKELGKVADSTTFKFQKAVEELRAAIAPVGEQFLKAITPVLEFAADILNSFNSLNEGVKNFVVVGGALLAGLGPIFLMTFGLVANGVANVIKGFATIRGWFQKTGESSTTLGEQFDYMTQEQLNASAVAASLERVHQKLEQRFTSEAAAISNLVAAYQKAIRAQAAYSGLPRLQRASSQSQAPTGYNSGVVSVPGPKGKGDIVPAMLTPGEAVIPAEMAKKYAPLIQGMIAGNIPGFNRGVFLGMPGSGKSTQKNRDAADQIYQMFLNSSYRDVAPTEYGHQLAKTSGHSFPIFGLGGVYMGPNGKKVFVKPVMDEKAALAEMRGTEIARKAHGLEAPKQRIVVIRDPQDVTRKRRFLALESELDAKFVNTEPTGLFNEEQYFRQLVASLVRVDKDLAAGNLFGNVVADVGPAGVFSRASGVRDYTTDLPSMEQQAMINLLGIKGGAKKAFAESTVGLMSRMTADQYHQYMIAEIQKTLPLLKQTIASFGLTDPAEVDAYNAMIKRLEAGLGVDWRKFHAIHSAVKPSKPKQSTIPGYAEGVVSVPGPKGKGDVVPAMLSPGEAVIPADKAKKYGSLINAMISGNIPGYRKGKIGSGGEGRVGKSGATVQRAYGANVTATSGLVGFTTIDPNDMADVTNLYMNEILKKAEVSANAINSEIDQWRKKNIQAIDTATQAVNSGVAPSVAYADLIEKFNADMANASGPVAKMAKTAEQLMPNIQKDLQEAQAYAKKYNLNIKESAEDAEKLAAALPDNMIAQALATPGNFGRMSKARQAASAMFGGASGVEAYGSPRFMLSAGEHPSTAAYKSASSQEHVSTTVAQAENKIKLAAKRQAQSQSQAYADELAKQAQTASPSKRTKKVAKDTVDGYVQELNKGVAASQSIANEQAKAFKLPGTRRATSDIEVYNAAMEAYVKKQKVVFDKIVQQHNMLGNSLGNYFGKIKTGEAFDVNTRQQTQRPAASGFENLNSQLMNVSFAFSSLSTLTTMFGGELGFINEALYGMSNSIFAITGVIQLLTIAKGEEIKALYRSIAAYVANTIETTRNTAAKAANSLQEMFSGGFISGLKNLGGVFKNMFTVVRGVIQGFGRFLPVIGAVITAFSVFQLISKAQEEQKQRLEGMGNAAFAAGEKLKVIAEMSGFSPTRDPGTRYQESQAAAATGLTQTEAAAAVEIGQSEQFKTEIAEGGKLYQDVENLKKATLQEAQQALQALLIEQIALAPEGTDVSSIKATVAAMAEAAGKSGVSLELPVELNPYESGNEQKIVDYMQGLSENVLKAQSSLNIQGNMGFMATNFAEVEASGRLFGSTMTASLEQIQTQFNAGKLTIAGYNTSIKSLKDQVLSLDAIAAQAATKQMFLNYGVPESVFSGITDLQSQLTVIDALAAGVAISDDDYAALAAAGEGAAERNDALVVEARLRAETARRVREVTKALKAKEAQQKKEQAAIDLQAMQDEIDALEKNIELLPDLEKAGLDTAEAYAVLADEKQRNIILDAQQKDIEAGGGTANFDKAIAKIKELNSVTENYNENRDKAVNIQNLNDYIEDLEKEKELKKNLETAGLDAADAQLILNSEVLKGAAAAAYGTPEWEKFLDQLDKYKKLVPSDTGGGTPDKTPFEQATEQLKEQRKELVNTANTYAKLRKAGVDVGKAFRIAKDPILAAALASEKVGTKKWRELLALINKVNAQTVTAELLQLTNTNLVDAKTEKNTAFLEKRFTKMGFSAEQIKKILEQIGGNPDLVQKFVNDLRDGKVNAESIRNYLASIKKLDLNVELSVEDLEGKVNQAFSDVAAYFAAKKEEIDIDFETGTNVTGKNKINPLTGLPYNTTEIKKSIKEAERFIADRQYAIDDYEYQLDGIQEQEDKINKAYDDRVKALDEIRGLNEDVAKAQQGQLSIADALSRGDIAAAAAAVQQMQADEAASYLDKQQAAMEKAREQELGNVRAANGMTRIEIEDKIKTLRKEIAEIEEKTLEPQQKALSLAEDIKDAAYDSLSYLEKSESEWKKIESGARLAKVEAEGYKKAIEDALKLLPQLNAAYGPRSTPGSSGVGTPAENMTRDDAKKAIEIFTNVNLVEANNELKALGNIEERIANADKYAREMANKGKMTEAKSALNTRDTLQSKLNAANAKIRSIVEAIAELRKKYNLASGGFVSGPGTSTSDSIPALLSNGEYVINAKATRSIGVDLLNAINANKFANGGMVSPRRFNAGGLAINTNAVMPSMVVPGSLMAGRYNVQSYDLGRVRGGAVNSTAISNDSVYNYSVNVSVQSNSNPDQIARAVIGQIRQIDSQRIRGNRF